jgi:hypothetical protein
MGTRKLPKAAKWKNYESIEWIENNPIMAPEEIRFVQREVDNFDTIFKAGVAERITNEKSKNDVVRSIGLPAFLSHHDG